jgi:hypothetical protein
MILIQSKAFHDRRKKKRLIKLSNIIRDWVNIESFSENDKHTFCILFHY